MVTTKKACVLSRWAEAQVIRAESEAQDCRIIDLKSGKTVYSGRSVSACVEWANQNKWLNLADKAINCGGHILPIIV